MRGKSAKNTEVRGGGFVAVTLNFTDFFHGWVTGHYGRLRHGAKLLARDAGVSPRTAEGYFQSRHGVNAETLNTLMARNAELRAEIDRLIEQRKTR